MPLFPNSNFLRFVNVWTVKGYRQNVNVVSLELFYK